MEDTRTPGQIAVILLHLWEMSEPHILELNFNSEESTISQLMFKEYRSYFVPEALPVNEINKAFKELRADNYDRGWSSQSRLIFKETDFGYVLTDDTVHTYTVTADDIEDAINSVTLKGV